MSKKNINLRGFTLVELILSMGILSILLTMLLGVFGNIIDVQLESKSKSVVDQDGRFIMAKFAHDFQSMDKASDQIIEPAIIDIGLEKDTLKIKIGAIEYTYDKDVSNNLQVQSSSGGNPNTLNSTDTEVTSISFKRIGSGDSNDTIQIKFSLKSKIVRPSGQETRDFQTTLGMP